MANIDIIAVGRMKNTPFASLWDDYHKRLSAPWSVNLIELETRTQAEEIKAISEKLKQGATIVALDERGKALASVDFAAKIQGWIDSGQGPIQFIIGGADGLGEDLRIRADYMLSFGIQTWPHLMVRVMLIEQIYRARQINAGHPYHRAG
jgi:23S rRNA (pseudouridine1915-N3)-methyltransferase